MRICHQFAVCGELHQWFLLPNGFVAIQQGQDFGGKNKKSAIDQGAITARLFLEASDLTVLNVKRPKSTWGIGGSQGRCLAMAAMEGNRGCNVVVANAIAVGKADFLLLVEVIVLYEFTSWCISRWST